MRAIRQGNVARMQRCFEIAFDQLGQDLPQDRNKIKAYIMIVARESGHESHRWH